MLRAMRILPGLMVPGAAWAHGGSGHFDFDLLAVVSVVAFASVTGLGTLRVWRRVGAGRGLGWLQAACLLGALVLLWLALVWPLEPLAGVSAAAHMTQHMLLILAIPPLLLLGRSSAMALHGLPRGLARGAGGVASRLRRSWRWLCRPGRAFMLHLVVIWLWHAPAAYEAALRNDWIHLAEHLTLLVTGLMFWAGVFEAARGDARSLGNASALVLGTLMHTGMLGALLTFAPEPLYPSYLEQAAPFGLTALEDQQLAGLIMWVPGGLAYALAILLMLGVWLRRAEVRAT